MSKQKNNDPLAGAPLGEHTPPPRIQNPQQVKSANEQPPARANTPASRITNSPAPQAKDSGAADPISATRAPKIAPPETKAGSAQGGALEQATPRSSGITAPNAAAQASAEQATDRAKTQGSKGGKRSPGQAPGATTIKPVAGGQTLDVAPLQGKTGGVRPRRVSATTPLAPMEMPQPEIIPTAPEIATVAAQEVVIVEAQNVVIVEQVATPQTEQILAPPVSSVVAEQEANRWLFDYAPIYYLALIALAELITVTLSPALGVSLHAFVLLILPLHFALARSRGQSNAPLLLALALAPLIRIMSLVLPLIDLPALSWYLVIAAPIFVATYVLMRALGMTLPSIGLELKLSQIPMQAIIASSGIVLGMMEFAILRPQAIAQPDDHVGVAFGVLALIIGTGLLEEVVFRGVMQKAAIAAMGLPGLVFIALVFAALHIGYLSILDLFFVFGVGLFFGWIVLKTKSIVGVTIAHSLTNILLYLVLPSVGLLLK